MVKAHIGTTIDEALNSQKLQGKVPSDFLAVGGKAVDADKLDGLDSTQFLRSDTSATLTGGNLTINSASTHLNLIESTNAKKWHMEVTSSFLRFVETGVAQRLVIEPTKATYNGNEIFHNGNKGSFLASASAVGFMSTADKSKLDAIQASAINQTTADGRYVQLTGSTLTGSLIFANDKGITGTQTNGAVKTIAYIGTSDEIIIGDASTTNRLLLRSPSNPQYWNGTSLYTFWHSGNFDPSTKSDSGHVHAVATTSANGFMSSTDKSKLDAIQASAINQTTADGRYMQLSGSTALTGSIQVNVDNSVVGADTGSLRLAIFKKQGQAPVVAVATGTTFNIQESNATDLKSSISTQTMTTLLAVSSSTFQYKGNTVFHAGIVDSHLVSSSGSGFMPASSKIKLDGIATGAEVNQNAFSNIAVSGNTTLTANSKTATLTFIAGAGMSITTDASGLTVGFTSTLTSDFLALNGTNLMNADLGFTAGQKSINFATSKIRDNGTGSLVISSTGTEKAIYLRPNGDVNSSGQVMINTSSFTYNGSNVWTASNFDPATKLNLTGGTMTGRLELKTGSGGGIGLGNANITEYGTGSEIFFNATNGNFLFGTAYNWDNMVSIQFKPASLGGANQTMKIGQLQKNNAGWTHGITEFYTAGTLAMSLKADNLAVFAGSIQGNQSGAVRIQSATGYIDVGSKNADWAHFYTDRAKYYFNKRIVIDEGILSSSDEDLTLQTSQTTRLTIKESTGYVGIGTTAPSQMLHVNGGIVANTPSNTNEGIKILPSGSNNQGGGRIFFSENQADTYGFSVGYNGDVANSILDWGDNSFGISRHDYSTTGSKVLEIRRETGKINVYSSMNTSADISFSDKVKIQYNATENSLDFVFI